MVVYKSRLTGKSANKVAKVNKVSKKNLKGGKFSDVLKSVGTGVGVASIIQPELAPVAFASKALGSIIGFFGGSIPKKDLNKLKNAHKKSKLNKKLTKLEKNNFHKYHRKMTKALAMKKGGSIKASEIVSTVGNTLGVVPVLGNVAGTVVRGIGSVLKFFGAGLPKKDLKALKIAHEKAKKGNKLNDIEHKLLKKYQKKQSGGSLKGAGLIDDVKSSVKKVVSEVGKGINAVSGDLRHHFDAIHTLHQMSGNDFNFVKNLAKDALGLKVPNDKLHIIKHLMGGSLNIHPSYLNRLATNDMIEMNRGELIGHLHGEMNDFSNGKPIEGGSLFSSFKHFVKKGASFGANKIKWIAERSGKIQKILNKAIQMSDALNPAISHVFGNNVGKFLKKATDVARFGEKKLKNAESKIQRVAKSALVVKNEVDIDNQEQETKQPGEEESFDPFDETLFDDDDDDDDNEGEGEGGSLLL